MDGVLKSFERCLEMRDPRLERLQSVLPIDLWRPIALSRPAVTAPPHSTQALCDRRGRFVIVVTTVGSADRGLGARWALILVCTAQKLPTLWVGCRAKGKRNESRRANRRLAARVSIICLELRVWARIALRWLSGSRLRSCPRSQLGPSYSLSGTGTTAMRASAGRRPALPDMAAWGSHAGIGRTNAPVVPVATKTPAATITATPPEH
jgi:hypothetical protein